MRILILINILLCSSSMFSQSVILFEQDSVSEVYQNADISDNFALFQLDLFYKNNTNDTINLKWRREFSATCPLEWEVFTADQFHTYVFGVNEAVYPITMEPSDSHSIIRLGFFPRMVPGCCDAKVIFFLDGNPDVPVDTGYYHLEINSDGCLSTTLLEKEELPHSIYPNPASTLLSIENPASITSFEILNLQGSLVYKLSAPRASVLDISFLQEGIYVCRIKNASGELFLNKLIKQ